MGVRTEVLVWASMCAALAAPPRAWAEAERGGTVEDARLRTLDGAAAQLLDKGAGASVLLFFRAEQERSVEALRAIGECQAFFAKRPVRFVGIVSGGDAPEGVRAALGAAGAKLPVLVDEGDALYARLGVRMHPAIFVLDRARKIVAFDGYRQVGLCEEVKAQVRRALGEISDAELAKAVEPPKSSMPGEDRTGVAARHVKFGRKLLAAGSVPLAHENARKSLAIAPSAGAWALEGDAFRAEGKCAEAVKAYESALKLDAADAAALAGKGACP